ncbi:MAG: MarR family transcriptional regulator [Hyphomonadaceae bacterium]|nr:MarR family transcriptional regulator [Hyphomonadaceae bacterium]
MAHGPAIRREVLFQLTDLARAMRTYIDQRAREHGMTRAQWGALMRLERQEGMTQAELAESLEVQPISLARLIDRLCDQRLMERRPHPSDRRANRLYLTASGRARLIQLVPLGREISAHVLASFSEEESSRLLETLLRIKSNIRKADAAARRHASGVRHAG